MKELVGNECFTVLDNKEYIFFYFGASWCKPCQEVLPKLSIIENNLDKNIIQFYKIDIDKEENNLICDKCEIKVVPAFLIFKDRHFLDRTKGIQIKKIQQMILNQLYPTPKLKKLDSSPNLEKSSIEEKDPFLKTKELFNKNNIHN